MIRKNVITSYNDRNFNSEQQFLRTRNKIVEEVEIRTYYINRELGTNSVFDRDPTRDILLTVNKTSFMGNTILLPISASTCYPLRILTIERLYKKTWHCGFRETITSLNVLGMRINEFNKRAFVTYVESFERDMYIR